MKLFKKIFEYLVVPQRLYVYYLAAIMVPNVVLCFTEEMSLLANICNLILPASVYALLFTIKRRPGMMIWVMFPFVFLAAFQLVLLYLFGNSIISVDMFLNVATTNFNEATELLNNIVPVVAGVFILYLPALILGIFSIIRKEYLTEHFTSLARRFSYIGAGTGVVLTVITSVSYKDYAVHLDMFPINVCYNLGLAFERSYDMAHYEETSSDFSYKAVSTHDKSQSEIYILVIGETSRACSWGLYGYERNTTPLLKKRRGVTAFSDVMTQSNTTHISVPMIMSLASAEDYNRIYNEKGIIEAFNEAGFYTAFFSNQRFNHSFIDIFGNEADSVVFLKEGATASHNISDVELTQKVDELLAAGHNKLFIVLHTYGSHFNYRERYPAERAVFVPDNIVNASDKHRSNLINAYDNTIVQTDRFLDGLMSRLEERGCASALLYASDHGEDIFDDGRKRFLHSSPTPTYYQMHIPFIVWTSDTFAVKYPDVVRSIKRNKDKPVASNASVIHTMLKIAGISTPYLNDSLSVASDRYGIKERHFINDHNLPVDYDKLGLDEEDFEQFRKHKIRM